MSNSNNIQRGPSPKSKKQNPIKPALMSSEIPQEGAEPANPEIEEGSTDGELGSEVGFN